MAFHSKEETSMASNFKISIHRNSESVYLELAGVFDGSSAYELIGALERCCHRASRAYIGTDGLRQVYPFGQGVLQHNLNQLNGKCMPLVFTGNKADQLASEGSKILQTPSQDNQKRGGVE